MKIVHRVSFFFLAALAVLLVIYSTVFYGFVRARLVQQFEQELHGALNSLVAAVEVEPEEVKWQPLEHTIELGAISDPDQMQWVVIGDGQQLVEQSRNASPQLIAQARAAAALKTVGENGGDVAMHEGLHILTRRLAAPAPDRTLRELDEFDEVLVVVARSSEPLRANLNRLLLLVSALPLAAWLVAAALGQWFGRSALQPVLDMSRQARSMTGGDFQARLTVADAGDELGDLATAFNTLLDRQHRSFAQQRRFTGDAAHELRTPLTVLLGQIDVSLRRARSAEEYAATLGLLRDQTIEMQKIVESLLFLARAEDDAVLPDCETIRLDQWLPEYLRRWEQHARSADIGLRAEVHPACPIRATAPLLARLLDNLIENALKYSPAGSRIEVALTCDDAAAFVSVEDHGHGISAEDQQAIFEPFFRSRAARSAGIAGSGLGLAIAWRIAAAFGGRLSCTSELARGTRFTLELPRLPQQAGAASS